MASKAKEAPVAADFDSVEYDAQFEDAANRLQDRLEAAAAATSINSFLYHAREQVLEQAVEATISSALTTIDMLFMARDDTAVTSTSLVNGSWDPEPAPEPCAVDNWLRAAIPETQQPKQSYMLAEFLKGPTTTQSVSRIASMRRNESKRHGPGTGRASNNESPSPTRGREAAPQAARSPQHHHTARRKQLTPEQAAAESRLREELDVRRAQLAVLADQETKDVEARAKITAITKQLKGKEYSYDHKGQVVPLTQISADGPALAHAGPQFAVRLPEDTAAGKQLRRGVSMARKDKPKVTDARPSGDRKLVNDFRETVPRTQPDPLQVMAPKGGVTLRGGGGASKQGPARAKQGTGMSREELDRYAQSAATHAGVTTGNRHQQQPQQPQAAGPAPINARLQPIPPSAHANLSSSVPTTSTNTAAVQLEPLVGMYTQNTLHSTAGPGTLRFSEGVLAQLPDSPSRLVGATLRQPSVPAAKPGTPDANPALVGAMDWGKSAGAAPGRHPPLETSKPSDRDRELEVGRSDRLPRDRVSQATNSSPMSPSKLQPHVPQPTFVHA